MNRCKESQWTYPNLRPTGFWDAVMNVPVVTQTNNSEAYQGAHIQREDWDQQRLHTLQVTVEQNSDKHNLERERGREAQPCNLITMTVINIAVLVAHTDSIINSNPNTSLIKTNYTVTMISTDT